MFLKRGLFRSFRCEEKNEYSGGVLIFNKKACNVLLISTNYPYPPVDGHKVRSYNLYKYFGPSFRCTWLIFGNSCNAKKKHSELCEKLGPSCNRIEIVPESSIKPVEIDGGPVQKILFPPKLSIGPPFYSHLMEQAVNREVGSMKYDVVFFSGFGMFMYCDPELLKFVPYLVDIIDSPSVLSWSYFVKETKALKKVKAFFNYIWAYRFEKIHFSGIKNMILISEVDARTVKNHCPQSKVMTITNGVDTCYFQQDVSVNRVPRSLLFTGVMNYSPNNDAMVYFIKQIFPLILKKKDDIRLMIAGPNPSPELVALSQGHPHVELLGYVDDIRIAFNKAEICISPLLSGAGVKNKVLEAWAMSKPIVATSLSCAGLEAQDGNNILLADTPADFADAVSRLLSDTDLRDQILKNGRKNVEENYSWESKTRKVENCLMDVMREFELSS